MKPNCSWLCQEPSDASIVYQVMIKIRSLLLVGLAFIITTVEAHTTKEQCIASVNEAEKYLSESFFINYILNINIVAVLGREPNKMDVYGLERQSSEPIPIFILSMLHPMTSIRVDYSDVTEVFARDKRISPSLMELLSRKLETLYYQYGVFCSVNSSAIDICCIYHPEEAEEKKILREMQEILSIPSKTILDTYFSSSGYEKAMINPSFGH